MWNGSATGAVGDFLGDQEVAAAEPEVAIERLQMQRMAIGRRFDVFGTQILDDRVAAGAGEAGSQVHDVEQPVHFVDIGADIGWLDAFEAIG